MVQCENNVGPFETPTRSVQNFVPFEIINVNIISQLYNILHILYDLAATRRCTRLPTKIQTLVVLHRALITKLYYTRK